MGQVERVVFISLLLDLLGTCIAFDFTASLQAVRMS